MGEVHKKVPHGVVGGQKLLGGRHIPAVPHVLVEVAFQPQERFADHFWIVGVVLDALDQYGVVKVRDLFKVVEDVVLVIADHPGDLVVRVVDVLDVVLDDLLQVAAKLFLSFNQLSNDSFSTVGGIVGLLAEHGLVGVHDVQHRDRNPARFGVVIPVEDSYFPFFIRFGLVLRRLWTDASP